MYPTESMHANYSLAAMNPVILGYVVHGGVGASI
jgi:hypothetical protein